MKKLMVVMTAALCAGFCLAAPEKKDDKAAKEQAKREQAAKDARLKELDKIISSNRMGWGNWNDCFLRYYCPTEIDKKLTAISDAERDEMKKKNLAAQKEAYELDPSAKRGKSYASALSFVGRYAEALPIYKAAIEKARAGKRPDKDVLGWGSFSYAECQYVTGDEKGAIATLTELKGLKIDLGRYGGNPSATAEEVLVALEDRFDDFDQLPRYTDAKAFPEPQKAAYEQAFTDLKKVTVRTKGMDGDDPRFSFFDKKLRRRGIEVDHVGAIGSLFSSGAFTLEVEVGAEVPAFASLKDFQKREAYEIAVGEKGATIKAATKQGALWGLVTFVQMLDAAKPAIRRGTVTDYPATAERGFLSTSTWPGCPEYALMCKFNNVDYQGNILDKGSSMSPLRKAVAKKIGEYYVKRGLTVYFGMVNLTQAPVLPLCSPRTLELQADFCRFCASFGAGVYYPYDDCRYPMNHQDVEKYKVARNCDAQHVDKLYRLVLKDYPDFKMIFCPPFYWGPDSNADGYSENREEYLASLKQVHPNVDFYWTGPMVKSFDMTKRQVQWFTELTGRKPAIFQNGMDIHKYTTNFGIDAFDFTAWHYPEYYEDISVFHANSHMALDASRDTTVAEGLWNPAAFDKFRAAKRGNQLLCGEKTYDILLPGLKALEYFDRYRSREIPVDILSEKPDDLQAKIDTAKASWEAADAYMKTLGAYPKAGLGHFAAAIGWAGDVVKAAKNPPDTLAKYKADIEQVIRQANEEVGVDKSKGDLLFTPADVRGGDFFVYDSFDPAKKRVGATKAFEHPIPKRLVRCLRGNGFTSANSFSFDFECDPFPPTGDYVMYINGMDDETPRQNTLRVLINGVSVGEQEFGFPDNKGYAVKTFRIPFTSMKRHNNVTVLNMTPGSNPRGTPWLMMNYVVLKKGSK